jgi:hypothetical protein
LGGDVLREVDVATNQPIDPSRVPSIHLVEAVLNREEQSYRFRAAGIDNKAGLLLGAAGVLVALVGSRPSVAGLIGQIFAAGSGGAAVLTLWPRVDKGIGPREVRDRYLTSDPTLTRMILLNTRLGLHDRDEKRLITKAKRLRLAAVLLMTATVAIVAGGIVRAF